MTAVGDLDALSLLPPVGAVRRDGLTGLPNRPHWLDHAPGVLARAARENRPASAVMIDLDGLGTVNEEQGLAAGDDLLASLGELWRALVGSPDLLARWGGDEFALLLLDADAADARRVVLNLAAAAGPLIGVHFGVAEWDRVEPAEVLLTRAGRALPARV